MTGTKSTSGVPRRQLDDYSPETAPGPGASATLAEYGKIGERGGAAPQYRDCADWLLQGPYCRFIDAARAIGDVSLVRGTQPPGRYPDPPFSDYSLIVTTAGRCLAETNFGDGRKAVEIQPGAMVVAPVDTACDYEKHGPCETLVLGLARRRVASLSEQATGSPIADLGACHEFFQDRLIEASCLRLWDEAVADYPNGVLFADHALNAVVATLLTRCGHAPPEPKRSAALTGERMRRVLDYLGDNLGEPVTLADLASVARLSEFHFARLFKQATGLAPHQFLIAQRVERAKTLIREGKRSLAAIALAVGFSSQSHLNSHFKRLVGCTPAQFRN